MNKKNKTSSLLVLFWFTFFSSPLLPFFPTEFNIQRLGEKIEANFVAFGMIMQQFSLEVQKTPNFKEKIESAQNTLKQAKDQYMAKKYQEAETLNESLKESFDFLKRFTDRKIQQRIVSNYRELYRNEGERLFVEFRKLENLKFKDLFTLKKKIESLHSKSTKGQLNFSQYAEFIELINDYFAKHTLYANITSLKSELSKAQSLRDKMVSLFIQVNRKKKNDSLEKYVRNAEFVLKQAELSYLDKDFEACRVSLRNSTCSMLTLIESMSRKKTGK